MNNRRKIFLIVLIVLVLSVVFSLSFGRYVYNNVYDLFLKSKEFYFYSDLLTIDGKEYTLENWNGESYQIEIELYNYENTDSWSAEDINYQVSYECSSNVSCTLYTSVNDTIVYDQDSASKNNVILYVEGIGVSSQDEVSVSVSVTSTDPYKKTLSATFNFVVFLPGISYSIIDSENSKYLELLLENTSSSATTLNLSYDNSIINIDSNNLYVINGTVIGEDNNKINSININIEGNSEVLIKFYKEDVSIDYTYPLVNNTSIITVGDAL